MKPTIFSYASIVLALGACLFSVKRHDVHHRKDVRPLAPSVDASKSGVNITISQEGNKNWVAVADRLIINFVVKNNTGQSLTLYTANGFPELNFSVTDEKHNVVPLTRYGNLLFDTNGQKSRSSGLMIRDYGGITLEPGGEQTGKILLNQIYDMSVPGKYFITASRGLNIGPESHLITSNTLEMDVGTLHKPTPKDMDDLRKQLEEQAKEKDKKNNETNSHQ